MTSLSPLCSWTHKPVTLGKLHFLIAWIQHFSCTFIVEPWSLTALLSFYVSARHKEKLRENPAKFKGSGIVHFVGDLAYNQEIYVQFPFSIPTFSLKVINKKIEKLFGVWSVWYVLYGWYWAKFCWRSLTMTHEKFLGWCNPICKIFHCLKMSESSCRSKDN